MNKAIKLTAAGLALLAAGTGLYQLGLHRGMTQSTAGQETVAQGNSVGKGRAAAGPKAGDIDPSNGKRILYYHDPMAPSTRFDKPGKSPFMDMMLVPVYADSDADAGQVSISPRIQQNLGLRTAVAVEADLAPQVTAVGNIAFNERDQVVVQTRAPAFVERLHARATLDPVSAGQVLAELYVPDWIAAQEEFLAVKHMQGAGVGALQEGARQRMRQAGMNERQIRAVEQAGKVQARIAVTAPIGGVVTEVAVREGMSIAAGSTLFRINGLGSVWANAEVPESQAALLRPGTTVQARSPGAPGVVFSGRVQAILPQVDSATRTLKARMELANPGQRLSPGMFVEMRFAEAQARKALLVPSDAVIRTGRRSVVMLAEVAGRFRPVEVQTGLESGGQTEITQGLSTGQRLVVSSQFLIDSEASLRGLQARLNGESADPSGSKPAASPTGVQHHQGHGKVEALGATALTLSHGPIASLQWGAMTMDFKRPSEGLPGGLKAGDAVDFEFFLDKDGSPQLSRITPSKGAAAATAPGAGK